MKIIRTKEQYQKIVARQRQIYRDATLGCDKCPECDGRMKVIDTYLYSFDSFTIRKNCKCGCIYETESIKYSDINFIEDEINFSYK